ncbi:MAG TPA: cation diffusion facilitator family transporter, partial [Rubrobacteraceae bacterium]
SPSFYAGLSIIAAVVTIALKVGAYLLTGSVGLFSDAAESSVNLVAAAGAFLALGTAARPPDKEHAYGHTKAEYFSSALESILIIVAAVWIAVTAIGRLLEPQPLENLGVGLAIGLVAAGVNGAVGLVLLRGGRRLRSAALRADGQHLLTDVWTSVGVVVGVFLVWLTGWLVLDPLIALLVAGNIVRIGVRLLNDTAHGLLDTALPPEEQEVITDIQSRYREEGIEFHALRTRNAGRRRFVSMHVLVPGKWSVKRGHDVSERIEKDITQALPMTAVFVHIEPLEDPVSWQDQELDRSPEDEAEG